MIVLKKVVFVLAIQLVALTFCILHAQSASQEVSILQTDRSVYIAGEQLYYKLYVLEAATKTISQRSKVGYIVISSSNMKPALKFRFNIVEGMANGSIFLPDTLSSGVYQLVAFTAAMKNYGEEQFFHKEIVIANRFDKELQFKTVHHDSTENSKMRFPKLEPEISTDKSVYGIREKVSVSLSKLNSKGNVAVTVYENPEMLLSGNSMIENLSLIKLIPLDKNIVTPYLFENKSKIIRGQVLDANTNKSVKNAVVLLSCIDTIPDLQYAFTDSNGMFQMLLTGYYNGKELFLTIKDMPASQHWKIVIEDEFSLSEKWNPVLQSDNINKEYLLKSQNIVYIDKSYPLKKAIPEDPLTKTEYIVPQLYHCPVRTLFPADFVSLKDFPEIVVELLPQISITKVNGKSVARIFNNTAKTYFNNEPAIFLDGVFVDDINKIIGLGSEQITKIDVIDTERIFGDLVFQGIISIQSKSNEIVKTKPANQSMRIKNDDILTGKNFEVFNPSTLLNRNIPYFRQLLYWNPDLNINETDSTGFEFYTSDNTANYIIEINGISEYGIPISARKSIVVNNQINIPDK